MAWALHCALFSQLLTLLPFSYAIGSSNCRLGELEPQSGAVIRNPKLRIAYFTQHHVNQLDMDATPVDFLLRSFPGSKPDAARAHLGSFGLGGDLGLQRIRTLSGGQKSRVAFALITWKKPHLLCLDEGESTKFRVSNMGAAMCALLLSPPALRCYSIPTTLNLLLLPVVLLQ